MKDFNKKIAAAALVFTAALWLAIGMVSQSVTEGTALRMFNVVALADPGRESGGGVAGVFCEDEDGEWIAQTDLNALEPENIPVCFDIGTFHSVPAPGGSVLETHLARAWPPGELSRIRIVEIGIDSAVGVDSVVEVRVYQGSPTSIAPASMAPMAMGSIEVPEGSTLEFFEAVFDPPVVLDPALPVVIAVRVPTLPPNAFLSPGGNTLGQDAPTYIAADGCGAITFKPLVGNFFPDARLVLEVCNLPYDCPPCTGDLTGSATVGVPDLLALLACWGGVSAGCECADLTGNGSISVGDLLTLLANWGDCPPYGACCVGTLCVEQLAEKCDEDLGDVFWGAGSSCEDEKVRCEPLFCMVDPKIEPGIEGLGTVHPFTAIVEPENAIVTSYKWHATWPPNAGHNPSMDFSDPTGKSTQVTIATWFADPDSRWASDMSNCPPGAPKGAAHLAECSSCTYHIHVDVETENKGDCTASRFWRVYALTGGMVTPWPIYTGVDTIDLQEFAGLWHVVGQGNFIRNTLSPVVFAPPASDFYNKVLAHEMHHVQQFASIEPWGSMWDVDSFFANVIMNLTPQSTEQAMRALIDSEVQTWHQQNLAIYDANRCEMEWQSVEKEYDVPPRYLEIKKEEVPGFWDCQF